MGEGKRMYFMVVLLFIPCDSCLFVLPQNLQGVGYSVLSKEWQNLPTNIPHLSVWWLGLGQLPELT